MIAQLNSNSVFDISVEQENINLKYNAPPTFDLQLINEQFLIMFLVVNEFCKVTDIAPPSEVDSIDLKVHRIKQTSTS